jgi:hypothetical protein
MPITVHNPDRFMADLRQLLAQGRKRIGLLIGAGTSASLRVDKSTGKIDPDGEQLVPAVAGLTSMVLEGVRSTGSGVLDEIAEELPAGANIEQILSKLRAYASTLGTHQVRGMNGEAYEALAEDVCARIGAIVSAELPTEANPFTELTAWIGGTERTHPVEIFTTNYDLLLEEAMERSEFPFFDGFTGAFRPFFDPASIARNDLPARWSRIWKLHGSLGWRIADGSVVRGGDRDATSLIYPDHLKYDHIQKLPFVALFDRLRTFLLLPDTLLITCGFSFADSHISAVVDECLAASPSTAVFSLQFGSLESAAAAREIAKKRPNFSIYASDAAQINTVAAPWRPGDLPQPEWASVRQSYWDPSIPDGPFRLGDFARFARFASLVHAEQDVESQAEHVTVAVPSTEET